MALLFEPVSATVANTGAYQVAASAVLTVTTGEYWKPSVLSASWSTSANAGNRLPKFTIADASANIVCEVVTTLNLAASLIATYNIVTGGITTGSFLTHSTLKWTTYGLPALTLGPGWTITPNDTAAIDVAGDVVILSLSYTLLSATIV